MIKENTVLIGKEKMYDDRGYLMITSSIYIYDLMYIHVPSWILYT